MANKYTATDLAKLHASGKTFPGGTSYPTADRDDLDRAIKAVGRGGASHDAIRKYLIGRAKLMGLSKMIPTNWNSDGSLKTATSRTDSGVELRRTLLGTRELRTYTADIELRDDDPSGHYVTVTGQPIVYGVRYDVTDRWGTFSEQMQPGCVRDLLANGTDTVLLVNHDMKGIPLARTNGGGLDLVDSPSGLTFSARLDTRQSAAADLAIALENRTIRQMSVGMVVARDSWNSNETERQIHALKTLIDVSAVSFPASPTTSIALANRSAGRMTTLDLRAERDARRQVQSDRPDRLSTARALREFERGRAAYQIAKSVKAVDHEIEQLEDGARYAARHGDLIRARLLKTRARRLRADRN